MAENYEFPEIAAQRHIDDSTLWVLSYYRSSELAGALLMGKMARHAQDDELISILTWHFAEEARHAWRWTEFIRKLGAQPLDIKETYQSNYFSAVGILNTDIELLAITQVFEKRVAFHLTLHRSMPDNHPAVIDLLDVMLHDEGPHIRWAFERLRAYPDQQLVKQTINKFAQIDEKVYINELKKFAQKGWKIPSKILNKI